MPDCEAPLARQLSELQQALSEGLQALPGAVALYLFGSVAEERGDGYADLDFQVITADPGASRAACREILSRVGPLAVEWDMDVAFGAWAAALLFADRSPYHKIDFGLTDIADWSRWRDAEGIWATKLWEQASPRPIAVSSAPPAEPFAPPPGTAAHFVLGQMLGATRYVKARKRGQLLTCWRFAAALADAIAVLLNMCTCPGTVQAPKLTTKEYVALDGAIAADARDRFLHLLDFSTPPAMDRAVSQLLRELVVLANALPDEAQGGIPERLSAFLLGFVERELAVP